MQLSVALDVLQSAVPTSKYESQSLQEFLKLRGVTLGLI